MFGESCGSDANFPQPPAPKWPACVDLALRFESSGDLPPVPLRPAPGHTKTLVDEARIEVSDAHNGDGRAVSQMNDGIATFMGLRRHNTMSTTSKCRRRQAKRPGMSSSYNGGMRGGRKQRSGCSPY